MVKQPRKLCVFFNTSTAGLCLKSAVEQLESNRIPEFRLKAEWILGHVLKCRGLELPFQRNRELNGVQLKQIASLVRRVAVGEPLQYALGDTEFMGRVFKTDWRALIPRPETETLVDNVLACKDAWSSKPPSVGEVGTGSGCIIISLALAHPEGVYVAVDASAEALDLSRENARILGVEENIKFVRGDLLTGVPPRSLNLVVSNPPYVSTNEIETLRPDICNHEPRIALDGGPDGFSVITRLVPQALDSLRPGGWLFMEMGEDQGERVESLMKKNGFEKVEIRKDLAGHDRMACGRKQL
jgi:release factor glutamine methyltransferase